MDAIDKEFLHPRENPFPIRLRPYFIFTISLLLFNIALYVITFSQYGNDMSGFSNLLTGIIVIFTVGYVITSLTLGLFVAFIPYKELAYEKRYWPSVLLVYFILNSLTTLFGVVLMIAMTFEGF